jgi:hypothetical protein
MRFRVNGIASLVWFLVGGALGGDAAAMTIWTGPRVTFTKEDFADFNQPENQDRLTDNVWITRMNTQGIFNIKTELAFSAVTGSPADTEWAFGTTDDIGALTFANWRTWALNNPPATVGQDAVLHLITDDIFIDIKFLSWTSGQGAGGGGFSYERTTPPPMPPMIEGDTNADRLVNIDDLNAVRNNFGETGPDDGTLEGDAFPFDGQVDIDDLNSVRNNFGAGAAVPEPNTALLAALAVIATYFIRLGGKTAPGPARRGTRSCSSRGS